MSKIFTMRTWASLVVIISLTISCGTKTEKRITVGSKNFTEQVILGEIMSILIEEGTDIKVERKLNLGGTFVCFNALKQGELDLYAEYTGTALTAVLKKPVITDKDSVYSIVKEAYEKQFGLIWLKPFGFNNTYTLTMRENQAEKLNIRKISDLKFHQNDLIPGFDHEFLERPDGYPGLIKYYGLKFKHKPREMDPGLMYKAIAERTVDLICGFATDGRIPAFDLVILEDDKRFFPPYYAAPLIRADVLKKYPEIRNVLNALASKISDEKMREMNYQVDVKERRVEEVAREFLLEEQIILLRLKRRQ